MTITIDTQRFLQIKRLYTGSHSPDGKMCAMEAVAYVAGEPWSDHPECACPVIGAFMRAWNDGLPNTERSKLVLPFIPRLIGTRGSKPLEERRACMAGDWLVRTHTAAWLRLAGLNSQAERLAGLPEITAFSQIPSIRQPLEAVRTDASAAWSAATDAALSAAWSAALDAAWSAASSAALDGAWYAACKKLKSTKIQLQHSAVELLNRMIEARD